MQGLEISGRLLVRNTLLNFFGQAVPLLIAIIAIPFIARGFGTERFGLLSLAWLILGYFTIFDLGLSHATTKYVAEALGKGEENSVPGLVWTAVTVVAVFGMISAVILLTITPLLAERILTIPPDLVGEARATFYLLAIAVPVVLVSGSFSGVLEARQRFDFVNAVRIPSGALTFLLPLLGLILDIQLPAIVVLILISRFLTLLALVAFNLRVFPEIKKFSLSFTLLRRLFLYGSWVTVTSIIGPVLIYLDRFLIASLLSLAAVAYYTVPYEAATRLRAISDSLTISLFPAFSTLEGIGAQEKLGTLFGRALKYELLTLGPIVLGLMLSLLKSFFNCG